MDDEINGPVNFRVKLSEPGCSEKQAWEVGLGIGGRFGDLFGCLLVCLFVRFFLLSFCIGDGVLCRLWEMIVVRDFESP